MSNPHTPAQMVRSWFWALARMMLGFALVSNGHLRLVLKSEGEITEG